MQNKRYSYESQPSWLKGQGDWRIEIGRWDSYGEASDNADFWKAFMGSEGVEIATRVIEIIE